jgi:hypothetical protein
MNGKAIATHATAILGAAFWFAFVYLLLGFFVVRAFDEGQDTLLITGLIIVLIISELSP